MVYVFGGFILDTDQRELRRAGGTLALQPRVFQVLAYLVAHRDRLVTREELIAQLWPGQFVDDSVVARCIMAARKPSATVRTHRHTSRPYVAMAIGLSRRSWNSPLQRAKGLPRRHRLPPHRL